MTSDEHTRIQSTEDRTYLYYCFSPPRLHLCA
jgi:hypothetical protein